MPGDGRDFNNNEKSYHKVFSPPRQGAEGNLRHSGRKIRVNMHRIMAPDKTG
jgi:hypothetical protein